MHKALRVIAPLAIAAIPLAFTPAMASADSAASASYQATLNPLNHSTGSGTATITLSGDKAEVKVDWTGLAKTFSNAPFPHVQHIHIGGEGKCPTMSADKNGDGVVSTTEGAAAYGGIGTTLSVKGDTSPAAGTDIKIAPGGDSLTYSRSITLTSDVVSALKAGTGVVVVHGLDPTTLSKKAQGEKSDLVPSLPLAATSPALCGTLSSMPSGGVATGTGSTAGLEDGGILATGGALLAVGAGVALVAARRRRSVEV